MTVALDHTHCFLIRHGQTRANAERYVGGSTDDPLTDRGHQQAQQVAEYLRVIAGGATAIYTSPLKRAQQTASYIGGATDLAPQIVDDLMEWDAGQWERLQYSEIPHQDGFQRECLSDPAWAPPGGEPLGSVQLRVVAAMRQLARRHLGQRIIVVGHGTALGLLLAKLIDGDTGAWTRYRLENCSVSELLLSDTPKLIAANQTDHLVDA